MEPSSIQEMNLPEVFENHGRVDDLEHRRFYNKWPEEVFLAKKVVFTVLLDRNFYVAYDIFFFVQFLWIL
jgi:hypothetical protein